jgi:hypothetical protein
MPNVVKWVLFLLVNRNMGFELDIRWCCGVEIFFVCPGIPELVKQKKVLL